MNLLDASFDLRDDSVFIHNILGNDVETIIIEDREDLPEKEPFELPIFNYVFFDDKMGKIKAFGQNLDVLESDIAIELNNIRNDSIEGYESE